MRMGPFEEASHFAGERMHAWWTAGRQDGKTHGGGGGGVLQGHALGSV